ncbi:MAG: hypothetical protein ABWK00_06910 [Desulfurococcaceae archaeon]
MAGCEEALRRLDEAIDALDKADAMLARLSPGKPAEPGVIYSIYQALVVAREAVVRAREDVYSACAGPP